MHVDQIGRRNELVIPDLLQKHGSRQQLVASLHHVFEQAKFARQQIDDAIAAFGGPLDQVELKRPDPQGRLTRFHRPAQQRLYPGDEFDDREGFGEIVVAAAPQPRTRSSTAPSALSTSTGVRT